MNIYCGNKFKNSEAIANKVLLKRALGKHNESVHLRVVSNYP